MKKIITVITFALILPVLASAQKFQIEAGPSVTVNDKLAGIYLSAAYAPQNIAIPQALFGVTYGSEFALPGYNYGTFRYFGTFARFYEKFGKKGRFRFGLDYHVDLATCKGDFNNALQLLVYCMPRLDWQFTKEFGIGLNFLRFGYSSKNLNSQPMTGTMMCAAPNCLYANLTQCDIVLTYRIPTRQSNKQHTTN